MEIPDGLKTAPFHAAYPSDLQTEWIEVMEHAIPLWVSDPEDEYAAFRTRVGLLEYSMLYRWDLRGPGAVDAADAIFSRSVSTMEPGTIAYGVVVDTNGLMVDDPTVAYYAPDHVLLVGGTPAVGEALREHLGAETVLEEVRERFCVLAVQGPRSRELVQRLTDTDMSNDAFPYYSFQTGVMVAGVPCQVNRIGFTAELGFEIVAPVDESMRIMHALLDSGQDLGATVCGAAALMMCRIESGMVMAGLEYDDTSSPFDCRLGWAVDFDKGPFRGRDALLDHKATAPDRVMTIRVEGDPDGLDGAVLVSDDEEIGHVTMAVPSPHLDGATIAMARMRRESATPGAQMSVRGPGGPLDAVVLKTPVYDPERTRVRS